MNDHQELILDFDDDQDMKPERVQFRFDELYGWVMLDAFGRITTSAAHAVAVWTVFELADPYEACELVGQVGRIIDVHSVRPEIDVRGNVVFLTATTAEIGLTEADFDFAESIDCELGDGQKAPSLLAHGR